MLNLSHKILLDLDNAHRADFVDAKAVEIAAARGEAWLAAYRELNGPSQYAGATESGDATDLLTDIAHALTLRGFDADERLNYVLRQMAEEARQAAETAPNDTAA